MSTNEIYEIIKNKWDRYIIDEVDFDIETNEGVINFDVIEKYKDLFDEIKFNIFLSKNNSSWYHKIENNENIINIILSHYDINNNPEQELYRSPVILFMYYLVEYHPYELEDRWTYGNEYLKSVFTDVGGKL